MDEQKKMYERAADTKEESTDNVLAAAEKSLPVANYISRVQLQGGETPGKDATTVQEMILARSLGNIIKLYASMLKDEGNNPIQNLVFSGNVIVNKDFQEIRLFMKNQQLQDASKDFSSFEIDLEQIIIDFKEFALVMEDFFDFLKMNVPSIVFLHNADGFLSKAYKARETSSFTAFTMRFFRFFAEKNVKHDKIVFVILADTPKTFDRRLLNAIDFTLDVDAPAREEREYYLKHLFEPENAIDYAVIATEMDGWTWNDIECFAKHVMMQKHAKELAEMSTKFLLDAVHGENGLEEFMAPSIKALKQAARHKDDDESGHVSKTSSNRRDGEVVPGKSMPALPVQSSGDPFKELLWQSAAEDDYDTLVRVLDHLENGMFVQEDRIYLARYPFLLLDDILTAKRKLDAAKNKIDMIKKHFKGARNP
jgi:hypothetical protein